MQKLRLLITLLPLPALAAIMGLGTAAPLTGCGPGETGGGGGDEGTFCFDYTGYKGDSPAVSFQADVLPIFRQSCGLSTSCHGAQSNPPTEAQHYMGPKLSQKDPPSVDQIQAIFDQNVGVDSVNNPDMKIVEPGAPGRSFLMFKLDGSMCADLTCAKDKTCGTNMPQPPSKQLAEEKRDIIRRWIAQGAKND